MLDGGNKSISLEFKLQSILCMYIYIYIYIHLYNIFFHNSPSSHDFSTNICQGIGRSLLWASLLGPKWNNKEKHSYDGRGRTMMMMMMMMMMMVVDVGDNGDVGDFDT